VGDELGLGVPLLEADDLAQAERRPIFSISQRPRFLSGAKRISLSAGTARTIFSALDEVQM